MSNGPIPLVEYKDRAFRVPEGKIVKTQRIDISLCDRDGCEMVMPEVIEKKWRILLQNNCEDMWPCPYGYWHNSEFIIRDGKSEYLARLMMGCREILVAWLEDE